MGLRPPLVSRRRCATPIPEFIAQVVQDARDYFDGKGAKAGAASHQQHLRPGPDGQQQLVQVRALPGRTQPRREGQPAVQQRLGE